MKITKICKTKEKVNVYFNDKKIELFPSTFSSYNLYINKIMEEDELERIKNDNKIEGYFVEISKRLILTMYSPKKVEEILFKKGAKKDEIKKVIAKLKKYEFINEEGMVEEIISYCDARHYGYNRIIKMLNDRKISKKVIDKIEYNSTREEKECILQIKSMSNKYKNKNEYNRKKSMLSALVRLGFNEELSLELVNKFSNSNHNNEINVLKLDYKKCLLKYSKKYSGVELNQKITCNLLSKGYRYKDISYVKETYINEIS